MTVFTCEHEWEAMMTCIYEAWMSRKGHENIRLEFEPIGQLSLFDEYIHVEPDTVKAQKVMDAVNLKISPQVYYELSYSSMAYEPDVLDNIYRVMILGFAYGPGVLDMVQYRDIMRNKLIRKRVGGEAWSFVEFLRFHRVGDVYVAHIEPKSRVLPVLAEQFSDRMPSEHWIIIDDTHKEAVVHPKDIQYYYQKFTDEEFERTLVSEEENDEYTDMWQVFFDTIAIKERANALCQRSHFPIWKRKHAVEFQK